MRKSANITSFGRFLLFMVGLFVAFFVVSQEVLDTYCSRIAEQMEQQEEGKPSDPVSEEAYLASCDVLVPGGHTFLHPFNPIFIFEINQEVEINTPVPVSLPLYDTQHYKTLFRQVISPNAP